MLDISYTVMQGIGLAFLLLIYVGQGAKYFFYDAPKKAKIEEAKKKAQE